MRLAVVVEGHGEVEAAPVLIRRVAERWRATSRVDVVRPFRIPKGRLVARPKELERAVSWARLNSDACLVMLDADDDCPAELGPALQERLDSHAVHFPARVVIADREFESWFVAAAESLGGKIGLPDVLNAPSDPERIRDAKGWLSQRLPSASSYREVLHQPKLAACIDLDHAVDRSRSFAKFRREILQLVDDA